MIKLLKNSQGIIVRLIFVVFLLSGTDFLYSSDIVIVDSSQNSDFRNIFNVGFVKNSNINYFNADLVLNTSIYNTDILVNNRFKSTVIKSNQDDYRDANSLSILVNRKINSAIVLGFQNGLIYSSDTKTSSNNKLIDISIVPFLDYKFVEGIVSSFGVGADYNRRADIVSNATILQINTLINQLYYEDYSFNSDLYFKKSYFGRSRTNQIVKANTLISANYSVVDKIEFGMNYNSSEKDFLNFVNNSSQEYLYERNSDNNYSAQLKIQFRPSKISNFNTNIEYNSQIKDRYFNNVNEAINNSRFRRNSHITKILLANSISFQFSSFTSQIIFDYEANDETFNSKAINQEVPTAIATSYQNIQKMNDYNSSRIRVALNNLFVLSRNDSLLTNINASLFRYNTPHKENKDEYDVSYSSIDFVYKHLFNRSFTFKLSGELKNQHYVYINSENSAQSNKLQSIKLKPEILYNHKIIYYNPKIEILANYHIYDFQEQINTLNTYSFRQISYIDSASITFTDNFSFSTNILCRYSLRSNLSWASFAENPLKGNLEQTYRLMINNKFDIYSLGLGLGYYKVEQIDMIKHYWTNISAILSPEVLIGIKFSNNGTLLFFGKYDFQKINNLKREVANVTIQTSYSF